MSFAFTVITAASLHLNKLNCSKWMILFPSVALLPNFWYNLTQDKTLIAAPDAPGNSSTKTQKSTTKKGYPQQPHLFFTSASSLLNIKLIYVLLGPKVLLFGYICTAGALLFGFIF